MVMDMLKAWLISIHGQPSSSELSGAKYIDVAYTPFCIWRQCHSHAVIAVPLLDQMLDRIRPSEERAFPWVLASKSQKSCRGCCTAEGRPIDRLSLRMLWVGRIEAAYFAAPLHFSHLASQ
jgi:hypothetical protein